MPDTSLFGKSRSVVGMLHLSALPGSPNASLEPSRILDTTMAEAEILVRTGFDGVMIENMHDAPYVSPPHGPETVAVMTRVACELRRAYPKLPIGVQVLSCGTREALAIALAAGADFIRVENFVFAHVADEGMLPTAEAGQLLRYRRSIGAGRVKVFADIKKKHASHAITADVSIGQFAASAEFFGADGVIVTGQFTGQPADLADIEEARRETDLPVLVGSGATPVTLKSLFTHADAVIVGSFIKRGGVWNHPVDAGRCGEFMQAAELARR